jgi:hypothetical protein
MRRVTFIMLMTVVLPAIAFAQVQPGSTGGTIGKREKSISGGEKGAKPIPPAVPAKPAAAPARAPASSPCPGIAGVWTAKGAWNVLFGSGDTTINADGTASHRSGNTARWSCSGGTYVFVWTHGFTDRVSLSPDGKSLTGTNQHGSAVAFVRN